MVCFGAFFMAPVPDGARFFARGFFRVCLAVPHAKLSGTGGRRRGAGELTAPPLRRSPPDSLPPASLHPDSGIQLSDDVTMLRHHVWSEYSSGVARWKVWSLGEAEDGGLWAVCL